MDKKIVSAFMLSLFTSFTSEILEESIIKKKTDLENLSFFLRVFWFLPCTVYETARWVLYGKKIV